MPSEAYIIREVTGSGRSVELRNRALPYRPAEWPGEQAYVQKWYPGNPQATLQILGPRESDHEIKGTWKTRYIAQDVTVEGFDELVSAGDSMTAETLALIFHTLRRAGNLLEVRWGPEIRRGILARFSPSWQRIEDVEWSARFVWSQVGDTPAPRAATTTSPETDLNATQSVLNDIAAAIPPIILPNVSVPIQAAFQAIQFGTVSVSLELAAFQGLPAVPQASFQSLEALVDELLEEIDTLMTLTTTGPYLPFIAVDAVSAVLSAETWRRDAGAAARDHSTSTIQALEATRQRVVPGFLRRETVREGETLRDIAQRVYGVADDWTIIADANGFTSAIVDVGTTVLIPRPPESGSGVRLER